MTSPIASPVPGSAPGFQPSRSKALSTVAVLALLVLPVVAGCSKEQASNQAPAPAASAPTASAPAANDPVIARVSGTEIRQSDLATAEEDLASELQGAAPDQKREQLIGYLADIITVAKAADAQKVGDTPEFRQRLALARNKLLMGVMLQQVGKAAITDEAMHKVYDEAVKTMSKEEEVHARHILVPTEEEANAIAQELKDGADFATLAKEKSKDPGAADGGDLGYFTRAQMVPEFADVAFKMYPGQVSNPVKSQFGWHIIKVEDKRTKPVPEFDKVKDQIETFVARKAQTDLVAQLREANKVERLDKPATPAPSATPVAPAPAAPAPDTMKK